MLYQSNRMHDAVVSKLIAASRGFPCDSMASCILRDGLILSVYRIRRTTSMCDDDDDDDDDSNSLPTSTRSTCYFIISNNHQVRFCQEYFCAKF